MITATTRRNVRIAILLAALLPLFFIATADRLHIAVVTPTIDWAPGGQVIADAEGDVNHDEIAHPHAFISEGLGSYTVFYVDGTAGEVRGQKLDADGLATWDPDGVLVGTTPPGGVGIYQVSALSDGAGGYWVVWDGVDATVVQARRVNTDGTFASAVIDLATTVPCNDGVTSASFQRQLASQYGTLIAPDGAGGFIATWIIGSDLCTQHIDDLGVRDWGDGATFLDADNASAGSASAQTVTDGTGGVFMSWFDTGAGVRVNHVDSSGTLVAGCLTSGVSIPGAFPSHTAFLSDDGIGGAVLTFRGGGGFGTSGVRATRVASDCTIDPAWPAGGAIIAESPTEVNLPFNVMPAPAGGLIIAFQRCYNIFCSDTQIFADRVSVVDGSSVWGGPKPVSDAPGTVFKNVSIVAESGDFFIAYGDDFAGTLRLQRIDGTTGLVEAGFAAGGNVIASQFVVSPSLVADGAGGVVVAMSQNIGGQHDIYAQRVDGAGAIAAGWGASGNEVAAVAAPGSVAQVAPRVAADEEGNYVVVWSDSRNGITTGTDLFIQKFGPTGAPLWDPDDVPVVVEAGAQELANNRADLFFADDAYFVAWTDSRAGNQDVYAQKFDQNGNPQWGANGVPLSSDPGSQSTVQIVSDGAGGLIGAWSNDFNAIYAQRISSEGEPDWGFNGEEMMSTPGFSFPPPPLIVSDGMGGAFIATKDTPTLDIYVQHVDEDGNPFSLPSGVVIQGDVQDEQVVSLIPAGTDRAIVVWFDTRNSGFPVDLFAQSFDSSGATYWGTGGVAITSTPNAVQFSDEVRAATDGAGGAIVAWNNDSQSELFVQRLDGDGVAQWGGGTPVSVADGGFISSPHVTDDGEGGAAVTWVRDSDIFATQLDATTGAPSWGPVLTISDVSNFEQNPFIARGLSFVVAWELYNDSFIPDIYAQHIGGIPPPPPSGGAPQAPPSGPVCGNAICESGEDSNICPTDCQAPPSGLTTPGRPTIVRLSPTQIRITIDTGGNGASATYSIQDAVSGNYVQADGSLGRTAVFRTYQVWGGSEGSVVTLTPNTLYRFRVVARLQ